MFRLTLPRVFGLLAVVAALTTLPAAGVRAAAEPTQEQKDRVEAIGARLIAVVKTHPAEYTWPPIIKVSSEAGTDNAGAYLEGQDKETSKEISRMLVSPSLLEDIIKDNDDTLAFIMGHELGHVLLKHVSKHPERDKTAYLKTTFTRRQEYEADGAGMKLALAAGYSFQRALFAPREYIRKDMDYSSFEGSGVDHPSWKDRIAALDKDQEALWRSMSAFDNGQHFLTVEQYDAAGRCFANVVESFPDCSEAWSNLGYSKLMQYCDGLETADIRKMGLGQIVVGGFYKRPQSLELKVRGPNQDLWKEAVTALQHALLLKPDLTLAKANLALAYLVSPDGKNVARASQLFQEAALQAADDKAIDPYTRAAVLVNAGVSDIAGGQAVAGRQQIDRGEQVAMAFAGPDRAAASTLTDAVLYNRALLLADSPTASDQAEAMAEIEKYLQSASSSSAWWPLAFERYTALCKAQGSVPKPEATLRTASAVRLRTLTSLEIVAGKPLTVSDPLRNVRGALGEATPVPLVPDTALVQMNYPQYGVNVIADSVVLALCLSGPNAPPLTVQGVGLGAGKTTLRVGMTKAQLEEVIKEDFEYKQILDPDVNYRFYPDLGLAVLVRHGVVQEMIIVQLPRRS